MNHRSLGAGLKAEVALLKSPAAVESHECQAVGREAERDGLCLAWLKFDLGKLAQTTAFRNYGGHEVAAEKEHRLLAGHLAGVRDINRNGQNVAVAEFRAVNSHVAVGKSRVAQAISESPLNRNHSVVVIGALHLVNLLADLVVVVYKGIDLLRIGKRKFSAEVNLTGKKIRERISTTVAWKHHVHDGCGLWHKFRNQARTALIQNQHHRLARLLKSLDECLLVR